MTDATAWRAVAARAASLLLRYPDANVLAALPTVRAALGGLPRTVAEPLALVAAHRAGAAGSALAVEYVELFDFRRRCCLHLTYYTDGDTRLRGAALARYAAVYRHAGLRVTAGELPDYLPAVLDLAAADDAGWALLRGSRVALKLLVAALAKEQSAYRNAVEAVLATLPPAGPRDLAAAALLARTGPPREMVGLEVSR
jgi:nitrate reductase molybdenum cofactor assembly chaperone NarJ/NarW